MKPRRLTRWVLLAAALAVPAGGSPRLIAAEPEPGPAPAPPSAADVGQLRMETPPRAPRDPSTDEKIRTAKERGFLTLSDCFEIAVRENEQMGRAKEDYAQARNVRLTARGSVLPQVTLEDNYYKQNLVTLSGPTGGTASAFSFADSRNQIFLHLQQPIFHGMRERYFYKYAGANIDSFAHRLEDTRRLLYASVARAFYVVLFRESESKALQDTVQVERERVKEVQARNQAGLARRTEVLLLESQLSRDESSLTRSLNDLQLAREQLTFLLTVPVDLPLRDERPATQEEVAGADADLAALIDAARANRSDLKQQEKTVEAARYQVEVARGEYLPTIDLEAFGYLGRTHYSEFAQATDWSAQIDFSFPLFDGGRIKANVLNARSRLTQAELDRDEVSRQVDLDVQAAFLTLQSDAAQLKTLEVSVASADENYRLVQEEYRAGLATNLEVFAAQNQLLSARLDLERQRYQVRLDGVDLRLVQGLLPGESAAAPPPETAASAPGGNQEAD